MGGGGSSPLMCNWQAAHVRSGMALMYTDCAERCN